MSVKQKFPNEERLQNYIEQNLDTYFSKVKGNLQDQAAVYAEGYRSSRNATLLALGVILATTFVWPWMPPLPTIVNDIAVAAIFFLYVWVAYRAYVKIQSFIKLKNDFPRSFHTQIFELVMPIFDIGVQHSVVSVEEKSVMYDECDDVKKSELITGNIHDLFMYFEDEFVLQVDGQDIFIKELGMQSVLQTREMNIGKLFSKRQKGLFVKAPFKRMCQGKTFVSTEGDEKWLTQKNPWQAFGVSDLQVTQFESNDFEKTLNVATTNPIEARQILTPDFMFDLYQWWKSKKQHIRVSFIDDHMYVLLLDSRINIGTTITKLEKEQVQAYIESIAFPILNILHLVEDVRR